MTPEQKALGVAALALPWPDTALAIRLLLETGLVPNSFLASPEVDAWMSKNEAPFKKMLNVRPEDKALGKTLHDAALEFVAYLKGVADKPTV